MGRTPSTRRLHDASLGARSPRVSLAAPALITLRTPHQNKKGNAQKRKQPNTHVHRPDPARNKPTRRRPHIEHHNTQANRTSLTQHNTKAPPPKTPQSHKHKHHPPKHHKPTNPQTQKHHPQNHHKPTNPQNPPQNGDKGESNPRPPPP